MRKHTSGCFRWFVVIFMVFMLLAGIDRFPVLAGWKADVGYSKLSSELGDDLPDGSGLPVCRAEASVSLAPLIILISGANGTLLTRMPIWIQAVWLMVLTIRFSRPDGIRRRHIIKILMGHA
jgi:hypothetical protein